MLVKFFLIITLFLTNLIADEFYINPYYLDKIKINSKSHKIINHYINRINPRYDAYNYKNEEYWASTFEFLSSAGGDCEDYVIAKMYSLKMLGIPTENMYMSAVKEKFTGGDHMVLALHVDKNSSFLLLDNLSTKVLPISTRVDLNLLFMFNEFGFYKLKNNNELIEIQKINLPAYKKLKKKEKNRLILKR